MPNRWLQRAKDWLPRSKYFYLALSGVSGSVYYLWWDRHQASLAQQLYEEQADLQGRQPIREGEQLHRLTILLAGADAEQLLERRRLFRRHTARLLLKAGIDWQVVEVNEATLARTINEANLDDPDHEEMSKFPRQLFIASMATKWMFPGFEPEEVGLRLLIHRFHVSPITPTVFLRDGIVATDSLTFSALQEGIQAGKDLGLAQQGSSDVARRKSWWETMLPLFIKKTHDGHDHDDDGMYNCIEPRLELVNMDLPGGFGARLYAFLNQRQTALDICQQTMAIILQHKQQP